MGYLEFRTRLPLDVAGDLEADALCLSMFQIHMFTFVWALFFHMPAPFHNARAQLFHMPASFHNMRLRLQIVEDLGEDALCCRMLRIPATFHNLRSEAAHLEFRTR